MKDSKLNKFLNFFRRHLIITNLLIMVVVSIVLVWLTMLWLNRFTHHGNDVAVPDVKGMMLSNACEVLTSRGFKVEVDSMYLENALAGTVQEQSPPALAVVKPGKTVTVKYVCYTRRTARVPSNFSNMSGRAAVDALKNLGMYVSVEYVPSTFDGILVSATYNGRRVRNGQELPMGSHVTVKIGEQQDYWSFLDDESGEIETEERIFADPSEDFIFSEDEEIEYQITGDEDDGL